MDSLDNQVFAAHMAEELGEQTAAGLAAALKEPASVSVRLNPFKRTSSPLPILEGSTPVPWSPWGHILSVRPQFTLHPLFHAGAYYVQDSSAMYVGDVFRKVLDSFPGTGIRVLDLCAAPGGKTTDLAASLREKYGSDFLLVANEVMRQRASVLADNVAVWGDPNVVVTSVDPKAFARFEGFFDIILADVPCSGEGMFRKDPKAVSDWSLDNVALCSARQKRIVSDVWPALKPSGVMIYSTCTFSHAENDGNIEWIMSSLGAEPALDPGAAAFGGVIATRNGCLLIPGRVPGEGQYVSAVTKSGQPQGRPVPVKDLSVLKPLRMGVSKGVTKGKDFIPDTDWILSLDYDRSLPEAAVDKATALHFLHKDTISLPDSPKGFNVLTYRGLPIGLVKNLGNRCNNLHPSSRRILMDIYDKI